MFAGQVPFFTVKGDAQVMFIILQGERPQRPRCADDENMVPIHDDIWALMERCWAKEPSHRRTADEAVEILESLVDVTGAGPLPFWGKVPLIQTSLRQPSPFLPSFSEIQNLTQDPHGRSETGTSLNPEGRRFLLYDLDNLVAPQSMPTRQFFGQAEPDPNPKAETNQIHSEERRGNDNDLYDAYKLFSSEPKHYQMGADSLLKLLTESASMHEDDLLEESRLQTTKTKGSSKKVRCRYNCGCFGITRFSSHVRVSPKDLKTFLRPLRH